MPLIFIVGPAGVGKTTFTAAFSDWLSNFDVTVAKVNLDPGALKLPYDPDIDVRDIVTVEEMMKNYGLGPNGAIIAAVEKIAIEIDKVKRDLDDLNADYILIDAPGQLEVFAFRSCGLHIAQKLAEGHIAIMLFLIDSIFANTPSSLVSALFLSSSVYFRFMMPQIVALNKIDLLPKDRLQTILEYISSRDSLRTSLSREIPGSLRELTERLCLALNDVFTYFDVIPISCKTFEGFDAVYNAIQNIAGAGEDYITLG